MSEYINWYGPAEQMMRCLECGAFISSGDTEIHDKWHDRITAVEMAQADMQNRFNEVLEIIDLLNARV